MPFRVIVLDTRDRLAQELTAAVVTLRLGSSQLEFGMQVRQLTSSPTAVEPCRKRAAGATQSFVLDCFSGLKASVLTLTQSQFCFFSQIFSACPGIDSSARVLVSAVIPRIPNYGVTVLPRSSWFPLVHAASSPDLSQAAHFSVRLHL